MARQSVPSPKKLDLQMLRETYVEWQLCRDGDGFGIAGVEGWLSRERNADLPSEKWNDLLTRPSLTHAALNREAETLRQYADPHVVKAEAIATAKHDSHELASLFAALDPYKATLYRGTRRGIVCLFNHANVQMEFAVHWNAKHQHITFSSIDAPQVTDILLATWRGGGSKAKRAREYLCGMLGADIHSVRHLGEKEFDSAVAVNHTGTRIFMAQWVVIFEDHDRHGMQATLYPATAWTGKKLELFEEFLNIPTRKVPMECDRFLRAERGRIPEVADLVKELIEKRQDQADVETADENYILLCHKNTVFSMPHVVGTPIL